MDDIRICSEEYSALIVTLAGVQSVGFNTDLLDGKKWNDRVKNKEHYINSINIILCNMKWSVNKMEIIYVFILYLFIFI